MEIILHLELIILDPNHYKIFISLQHFIRQSFQKSWLNAGIYFENAIYIMLNKKPQKDYQNLTDQK